MDQLKVYLKQAVKYRFWIAFGISLLLPMIGYFVGAGTINAETTKREGEINSAKTEIGKFTMPGIVNAQYQPLAAAKKEVLVQDVDATWRKLFATQEPLLKWPPEVSERFRKWGRQYPKDIDRNQIQSTIIDYTVAYPDFVEKIYKVFKPFNYEDGTGIVVAPDSKTLLAPAGFKPDEPPDLSKIWSEQDRLWVITALLDAVAKVNEGVGAKDWDGAVVKQILSVDVGSTLDQDQVSIAKGVTLVPADTLTPDGAPPPPPPSSPGVPGGPPGMGGPSGTSTTHDVFYLKTDSQQFKALPIMIKVLVDQARLPNFLVGLENSPMAIQVNEVEIAKPLNTVSKPAIGEQNPSNMGMGMGGRGGEDSPNRAMSRAMGGMSRGGGFPNSAAGQSPDEAMRRSMGGMPGGGAAKNTGGTDIRGQNKAQERADKAKKDKEAAAKKGDAKKIDQYFNVIEVTVYGQARFYLAPPPPPQAQPSTASTPPVNPAPTPEAPKAEAPKAQPTAAAPDAAKKDEAPKAEAPKTDEAPKAEATKKDEAPKAEPPKAEEPKAEAPKAEPPKAEEPKPEAPKPEAPKVEPPKADPAAPKS